jgi:hypothetical protein
MKPLLVLGMIAGILVGWRWIFRSLARKQTGVRNDGVGPHRHPYVEPFMQWEREKPRGRI